MVMPVKRLLFQEVSPLTQVWFAVIIVGLYIIALVVGRLTTAPWFVQQPIATMVGGFIAIALYRWRHRTRSAQ